MKSLSLLFASIISFLAISSVSATEPVACTMDYTPVCGAVQVQCIRAPCYPVYQTFSNMCGLKATPNVTFVKQGECGTTEWAPVILSEKLKIQLKALYDNFIVRISSLDKNTQIKELQALATRIKVRATEVEAMKITDYKAEMHRDLLRVALQYLAKLTQDDIVRLTLSTTCTPGATQEIGTAGCNPPSCATTYTCQSNSTWNTGVTGPCWVCAHTPEGDVL